MRRTFLKLFTFLMFLNSFLYSNGSEPLDYVLVSRKISPEMEASFNGHDKSKISNFWAFWLHSKNIYDYVNMIPTRNGWKRGTIPFTSPNDASMNVYGAWGSKGIYLLFEVIDDQSCDNCISCLIDTTGKQYCPADPSWMNDAIDVYIDKLSTARQLATINSTFIDYSRDRQTKTMVQIQFRFGAQDNVTNFRLNKYDQVSKVMAYYNYNFTYAADNLDSLIFKTVKSENPNLKFQEWFIPWSLVGNDGGVPVVLRVVGEKFGLVLGYNDADNGADAYDALRWKNQADPTKRVPPDSANVCQSLGNGQWTCDWKNVPIDSWCDFQLGPSIESVDTKVKYRSNTKKPNLKTIEYFTIAGNKLKKTNGQSRYSKGAVILERVILQNGFQQTAIKTFR